MALNKVAYIDYYTRYIDESYSPSHITGGKLYLFRYVFYKHASIIGCDGRISRTDVWCPKCGSAITLAPISLVSCYKGKTVTNVLNILLLNNDWASRVNGAALQNDINSIYISEGWPPEPEVPAWGEVVLDLTYGVNGILYPANAMTLSEGVNLQMHWKLINNSGVDAIIKHTLQIKAHKGWQTWHGTSASVPHSIQQDTVLAGASLVILSYRHIPMDWYGSHGVDWRILDEHSAVIYGLCYYSPGTPPVYKLYNNP